MKELNVIAIMGKSKSGKNASGDFLVKMGLGHQMAFADKLKKICSEMYGISLTHFYDDALKEEPTKLVCLLCPDCKKPEVTLLNLDGKEHGQCKLCGVIGDVKVFRSFWTPRTILQHVGTEGLRRVDDQVWVRYALEEAKQHLRKFAPGEGDSVGGQDFVVITDCRFKSELDMVHAAGGEVWRLRRPETDKKKAGIKGHSSEDEMDTIPDSAFQAIIMNDSTLDTLRGRLAAEFHRFKKERIK